MARSFFKVPGYPYTLWIFFLPHNPLREEQKVRHTGSHQAVFRSHINKVFILSHSVLPEALMEWI